MVRLPLLTGRQWGRRPKVAVFYEDVMAGYRCADWCALHGYQAILTSAVHHLERDLPELRPDVIVIGLRTPPTPFHSTVPRLRTMCPNVPIIAVMNQPAEAWRHGSHADLAKMFGADVFMCHSLDPPTPFS